MTRPPPPIGDQHFYNANKGLTTYVYESARRPQIKAGTRCASVKQHMIGIIDPALRIATRRNIESKIIDAAVKLWEHRWGEIPWGQVTYTVTHTGATVEVEFRVTP